METNFEPKLQTIDVLELNKAEVESWQKEEVEKILKKDEKYKLKVKRNEFKNELKRSF